MTLATTDIAVKDVVYASGLSVKPDIVITNPVGNSDDLARGLKQNLPTSFMQALGVRG